LRIAEISSGFMSTIYLFFKAAKVCKANAISKVKKRKTNPWKMDFGAV